MRRGDFVTVATQGDYGKPRPALIVQSDLFAELDSVVFCPLTTHLHDKAAEFRIDVLPSATNGVRVASQIMIDKITVLRTVKIGQVIGKADDALMVQVSRSLAIFLGVV